MRPESAQTPNSTAPCVQKLDLCVGAAAVAALEDDEIVEHACEHGSRLPRFPRKFKRPHDQRVMRLFFDKISREGLAFFAFQGTNNHARQARGHAACAFSRPCCHLRHETIAPCGLTMPKAALWRNGYPRANRSMTGSARLFSTRHLSARLPWRKKARAAPYSGFARVLGLIPKQRLPVYCLKDREGKQ